MPNLGFFLNCNELMYSYSSVKRHSEFSVSGISTLPLMNGCHNNASKQGRSYGLFIKIEDMKSYASDEIIGSRGGNLYLHSQILEYVTLISSH